MAIVALFNMTNALAEGYQVAHRRIEKVYKTDGHSAVAIAGARLPTSVTSRSLSVSMHTSVPNDRGDCTSGGGPGQAAYLPTAAEGRARGTRAPGSPRRRRRKPRRGASRFRNF